MKKKIFISFLVIFLIICILCIILKLYYMNKEKEEIIEILEDNIAFQVYVDNAYDDIDKIEKQISEINGIKSIEFHSKEQVLEEMKKTLGADGDLLDVYEGENNIFPNSFIIKIEISNLDDIENIDNIEKELLDIEGIDDINSNYDSWVNVYENYGIDGLRQYLDMLNIASEGDSEKLEEYFEQNEDAEELLRY